MLLSGSCLHIAQKMSLSPYLIYEPFLTPALSVLLGCCISSDVFLLKQLINWLLAVQEVSLLLKAMRAEGP